MYDGTEILEAAFVLQSLDRAGAQAVCVAPAVDQLHAVDHLTGVEVEGERRSVLLESARLARGKVQALSDFWSGDLQGVVVPGGYGAPKNLLTGFMQPGAPREPLPEVRVLLDDLAARRRPVGSISLGRAVVAAWLGEPLDESDLSMGAADVRVDEGRKLVFTPGFLSGARLSDVARGIGKLVEHVLAMAASGLPVMR